MVDMSSSNIPYTLHRCCVMILCIELVKAPSDLHVPCCYKLSILLMISVSVSPQVTQKVLITVTDLNDNSPVFENSSYSMEVEEGEHVTCHVIGSRGFEVSAPESYLLKAMNKFNVFSAEQ